ncbi:MAG TPA: AI-2E family transporter [Casimicrobiaceae bacterium]|nr:AI-2E family transporter [Casimicrobiaceae bacterium]
MKALRVLVRRPTAPPPFAPAIHLRVAAGSIALGTLATLASAFALSWGEKFLVPLLLGIITAYTLNPLVAWLESIRIPRAVGTVVVMTGVLGALVLGAYSLRGELQTIIGQLPETAAKVSAAIEQVHIGTPGNLQKIQSAATKVERATAQAAGGPPATRESATHVVVDQPTFRLQSFLWAGSMGAVGVIGQAVMLAFLVFFLLLGGDQFKRKLVRLAGPSLSNKKTTVHILDDINGMIQKYMFMLLVTDLLVAALSWIAFRWIGLDNAGAWAVAAGLLHTIPYLGPGATAALTGMAAFMQFESISRALIVSGASLAIATVVGSFVATLMVGRIARMNSAAVFISLLFWGWLWGVWGLLLSSPIIVIVKVVSQHVDRLHPVAEMLGE